MSRPAKHHRDIILRAAMHLFFTEGVGVSTTKVAVAAGVSSGTLFNYFPTKQGLLDALYLYIRADLARAPGNIDSRADLKNQLRQGWDRWFTWASKNREAHTVVTLLHQSHLVSAETRANDDAMLVGPRRLLEAVDAAGALVNLPIDYLTALVEQNLNQAIIFHFDKRQSALAFEVLWNGMTKTPTARTSAR